MLAPRPFELTRRDGVATVWWRAHPGRVASNLFFAIALTVVSALVLRARKPPLDPGDLFILAWVLFGSASTWYATLAGALNRVTLTFDRNRLRVAQGPLLWRRAEVATSEVTGFVVSEIPRGLFYRVQAITAGGPVSVAEGLSEERAQQLKHVLESELRR